MTPETAKALTPPEPPPPAVADPLTRFLGMVSPEAMQEALDALGYSIFEHVRHAVSIARNDNPKIKAAGIGIIESMHERRLRHSGHTREVTLSFDGPDVRAHVSTRGIDRPTVEGQPEQPHDALPDAPPPIVGLVVHRPAATPVQPAHPGHPSGGDALAVPPGSD